MPAAALEIAGLSAGYGPTVVLEDVSLTVPAGGRLSVLGRNGMGKTTLLAALMGLNRRYAGAVRI
ncbi:ATP-binding cassette domain-containing protein, partial [Mycobacterium tuberculosis]|nr:ATP-binding cassette domain-containing protein [Mycobacterium tuberculosis]